MPCSSVYYSVLISCRWFALVRTAAPWLAPRQGRSELRLDTGALLCSFLSPLGKHMVFLGINGINDVAALFQSGDSGELLLNVCLEIYPSRSTMASLHNS